MTNFKEKTNFRNDFKTNKFWGGLIFHKAFFKATFVKDQRKKRLPLSNTSPTPNIQYNNSLSFLQSLLNGKMGDLTHPD